MRDQQPDGDRVADADASSGPDRTRLFGADPANYHDARPEYPERVYDLLTTRCGLGPGTATLEIGPGTGLATHRLLDLGADPLVAVEPDARLAQFLTDRLQAASPALRVLVAPFETVDLPAASFDLVASATAFHWLDQRAALAKAADLLRPGGWLALWWMMFGDETRYDAFHEATVHLLAPLRGGPSANVRGRPIFPLDVEARLADIRAARRPWRRRARGHDVAHPLDPDQIRALYATFPTISSLPKEPECERILDALAEIASSKFNGVVERQFGASIYLTQRH